MAQRPKKGRVSGDRPLRTWRPITWRLTRIAFAPYVLSQQKATAQLRHNGDRGLAVANSQNRAGIGAGEESRTPDLRITNALLYQLSYAGGAACCKQPNIIADGSTRCQAWTMAAVRAAGR